MPSTAMLRLTAVFMAWTWAGVLLCDGVLRVVGGLAEARGRRSVRSPDRSGERAASAPPRACLLRANHPEEVAVGRRLLPPSVATHV